jgi:hypothetical protein
MDRREDLSAHLAIADRDSETSGTPEGIELQFHTLTPTQQSPLIPGLFLGKGKIFDVGDHPRVLTD